MKKIFVAGFLPLFLFNPLSFLHWSWPSRTSVDTIVSSSTITVRSGNQSTTTTTTFNTPYGVRNEVVSINGKTYSTTTPLTADEVKQMRAKMEKRQKELQDKVNKMLQDQQKFFRLTKLKI